MWETGRNYEKQLQTMGKQPEMMVMTGKWSQKPQNGNETVIECHETGLKCCGG